MPTLGDLVKNVAYNLGNRTDLTQPIVSDPVTGVVVEAEVVDGGEDYQLGDILELVGGDATVEVIEVSEAGEIEEVAIVTGGSGYTAGVVATTGGAGTGATVIIVVATINSPSRIDLWLKAAYINLMMENRFPGTEGTYSFYTVQGQDVYPYPEFVRAIEALTLYRSDGTVITVETKDIKYIRRMNSQNQAAPSMWCEYGNSIYFRPVPDGAGPYLCTLDVWMNPVIATPIEDTEVLLPMDWIEALEYAATVRGHTNLQEEDKAHSVQSLLYGYTDQAGKYTPGMIQNLQNRLVASAPFKDWGMQPKGQTQPFTRRR